MSSVLAEPLLPEPIAAALRGEAVPWSAVDCSEETIVSECRARRVTALLLYRLRQSPAGQTWPRSLRDELAREVRAETARELVRRHEIVGVLDALAAGGVRPVLFKGAPLAYSVYPAPAARPRGDTDLLIPHAHVAAARRILADRGYAATVYCDGEFLFRQFELQKTDTLGIVHALDVHWKISTQTLFCELLSYDELMAEATPVPALGAHARGASLVHALVLACVHPVMHHRNEPNTLWTYDIHLLASSMSRDQLRRVGSLAAERKVAAIVRHGLEVSRAQWRTTVPGEVMAALGAASGEPSARYLAAGRRWRDELVENVRYLPGWRARIRLLREVVFPSRDYMRRAHPVVDRRGGAALLPIYYLYRLANGAVKELRGQK